MRNQNKRQTNGLFALIFDETIFFMYKAAYLLKHRCDSSDNLKLSS